MSTVAGKAREVDHVQDRVDFWGQRGAAAGALPHRAQTPCTLQTALLCAAMTLTLWKVTEEKLLEMQRGTRRRGALVSGHRA